jgi:hypothetical protein
LVPLKSTQALRQPVNGLNSRNHEENSVIRTTNNHQSESTRLSSVEAPADLIQDIYSQLQTLVSLNILLTRRQIEAEVRKRLAAVIVMATGAGCVLLAALLLSLAFVHGLHWLTLPTELTTSRLVASGMPLWACHAIISSALALLGSTLLAIGRKKITSPAPLQPTSSNHSKMNHQ